MSIWEAAIMAYAVLAVVFLVITLWRVRGMTEEEWRDYWWRQL